MTGIPQIILFAEEEVHELGGKSNISKLLIDVG